jgi:probable rRNA maturation factor
MTVPEISVRNLQRRTLVNIAELETFAADVVKRCLRLQKGKRTDLRKLREIFVWLISDRRISRIHLQFLGESGPTDVITFHDGEIFISVETARRNACEFGNSLMNEIKLDMVHGLLHLHGFDDSTPADLKRMKDMQEKILRGMGIQIGVVSQV